MTLERLLDCSAEELEKMTDDELRKFFEPYLRVTRPELVEKPAKKPSASFGPRKPVGKKAQANAILAQLGIDLRV